MKAPRTSSTSLAVALFFALASFTLQANVILARTPFGRRLARKSFLSVEYSSRSKHLSLDEESNNVNIFLTRSCRGGALQSDGDDEEEYDDEYDSDEEEEAGVETRTDESPTAISSLVDTLGSISKAIMRAFNAAIQGVESEEAEELSVFEKVVQTIQNMISATFNPDAEKKATSKSTSSSKESKASSVEEEPTNPDDFGSYLSRAYGATDGRKNAGEAPIVCGTLNDALTFARSSARLLVVLIPSAAPHKSKSKADSQAITSFLSAEVAKVAKKKARKKGETASFVLWASKPGSSEANQATKRLKVKPTSSKGDKRPILLVAYAAQKIAPNGVLKIAPKVLAQHHCSPPPSSEAMAQWMNELRKRYSKQFAVMQTEISERQIFKERKEGYKESMQSDVERKIREKKEEAERLAKEQAEKESLKALEKRRAEFLESLPEEPGPKDRSAITLSVRHPDGRSEKRKFAKDTQLQVLFNWVDASFQMERELLVLTTMNGKQSFSWEEDAATTKEKTLKEAGLGRMVAFRVSEKKVEEEAKEDDKEKVMEEDTTKKEA